MPPVPIRVHDYAALITRWRKIAGPAGLTIRRYTEASGYALFVLESKRPPADAPSVYFSAGIHGDEPASTEGLLTWAAQNTALLRSVNAVIFPCLNPWGLVNNNRLNEQGLDLNRTYHNTDVPQTAAQVSLLEGRQFDVALMLHEDYDAHGTYIYEVTHSRPFWAEHLMVAAERFIPADIRKTIEGRRARRGIVRRRVHRDLMPFWPEAFLLHFHHARRTFTIETPSEWHIDSRVEAQKAVLSEALRLCLTDRKVFRSSKTKLC